jgi:hypothetical protein
MNPGTVFQLVGESFHPHIVISEPLENRVLVCNLTDKKKCKDSPCFFKAGEHEWITKESGIAIRYIHSLPRSGFAFAIKSNGIRVSKILIPLAKVQEICDGLLKLTSVPEMWKSYLR